MSSTKYNLSPAPNLKGMNRGKRIDAMVAWFHANFEDPAHNTPYETAEGGYQYIWGGPYDAREEISEAFPGAVEGDIAEAVDQVEVHSTDWVVAQARIIDDIDDIDDEITDFSSIIVQTPRFPDGLSVGDLSRYSNAIQQETMAFWFLAHCEPAANSRAAYGTTPYGVAAYGGGYFDGRLAENILEEVFAGGIPEAIRAVSSMFSGYWRRKTLGESFNYATSDDVRQAIASRLEEFAGQLQVIAYTSRKRGGFGDNGGPALDDDQSSIADETLVALKAVAEMRLAVASNADPSILGTIWSDIGPIAAKVGKWTLCQVDTFFASFTPAAGKALGDNIPSLLIAGIGFWCGHMAIATLVALLLAKK